MWSLWWRMPSRSEFLPDRSHLEPLLLFTCLRLRFQWDRSSRVFLCRRSLHPQQRRGGGGREGGGTIRRRRDLQEEEGHSGGGGTFRGRTFRRDHVLPGQSWGILRPP